MKKIYIIFLSLLLLSCKSNPPKNIQNETPKIIIKDKEDTHKDNDNLNKKEEEKEEKTSNEYVNNKDSSENNKEKEEIPKVSLIKNNEQKKDKKLKEDNIEFKIIKDDYYNLREEKIKKEFEKQNKELKQEIQKEKNEYDEFLKLESEEELRYRYRLDEFQKKIITQNITFTIPPFNNNSLENKENKIIEYKENNITKDTNVFEKTNFDNNKIDTEKN